MRHFASRAFWQSYNRLPEQVRVLADKNYALLKSDPHHPSLQFKKVGRFWSVRVGLRYRALATSGSEMELRAAIKRIAAEFATRAVAEEIADISAEPAVLTIEASRPPIWRRVALGLNAGEFFRRHWRALLSLLLFQRIRAAPR